MWKQGFLEPFLGLFPSIETLVTVRPICDEETDATSYDSEEEIIEEFGSSDDTLDGELHAQLI